MYPHHSLSAGLGIDRVGKPRDSNQRDRLLWRHRRGGNHLEAPGAFCPTASRKRSWEICHLTIIAI